MNENVLIKLIKVADKLNYLNEKLCQLTGGIGYHEGELAELDNVFEILIEYSKYPEEPERAIEIIDNNTMTPEERYKLLFIQD